VAKVRCRFAPSPTGHLHIGGARTALFNWLFARHQGGEFILRIEDTDVERSKEEYTRAILAGLQWLGLDWDGELIYQSKRLHLYRQAAQRLLSEGKAYYCSCSAEELEAMRADAMREGRKPKYDGRCRDRLEHPADRPRVIRFKSSDQGETVVDDIVQGRVTFDNAELDDLIIVRSDGTPTYNFCAVIDDHDLAITHVIRGGDHLNNTPRQIQLYQAFGWEPPTFAHHPLILGEDRSKLSKRHGATSLISYQDMGYLPEAMRNFLARIGWSHGDQELFSREELIRLFELQDLGKAPGVWNPEKLLWLNGQYIRQRPVDDLVELALPFYREHPFYKERGIQVTPDARFRRMIELAQPRVNTVAEFPDKTAFYFFEEVTFEEKAMKKFLQPEAAPLLGRIAELLAALPEFEDRAIGEVFTRVAEEQGLKLGKVAQPVRVAVTGTAESPGLFEVLAVLGRERTLARIQRAIAVCGRPL